MRRTDVFNAKNQDTLHNTALTLDVMNVMNKDILSWTALTGCPLQEHWHHTTRHTETATPDQALDTTWKTENEETSPDKADTIVPAIMTGNGGCCRSPHRDRHSHLRSSSRQSHSAH